MPTTATNATKKTVDIRREVKLCPTCTQRFSRDAVFCPFDGSKLEPSAFDPLADPLIGSSVDGRYQVVSVLGEGGMGRIYEVRHSALDRSFAMKVLRPELARDVDLAARFILEAKATASVKHPNVVQITDFGRLPNGVPFFVMELLLGHTLGEVIKAGGPIPAGRAVRILRKVAGALAAAHVAGVVHRDLKPDNVFLVGGSRDMTAPGDVDRGRSLALLSYGADVRVVDFGAAKIVGSSRVTRADIVFGTPHYMSPEQASGQAVDHRTDVYSLGVIMYEMFTGRVPFEADTYMGVLTQHMFVQPVPPSQVAGAASELGALEDITLKCLEKRAEDRFGSMDDVVVAIDQVVKLRGDDGTPPTPPSGWPAAGTSVTGPGTRAASSVRPRLADELELPSLEEMRVGGDDVRLPYNKLGSTAWLGLRIGVGVVGAALGALGTAHWLRFRAPTPSAAASAASAASAEPAAPPAPSVAFPLPAAPSVTQSAASSTPGADGPSRESGSPAPAAPRIRRPRSSPETAAPQLDDVGDPFARKH